MDTISELKKSLENAKAEDKLSLAILARDMAKNGIPFDEKVLNRMILAERLAVASVEKPETLRALAIELQLQGYVPKPKNEVATNGDKLTISPTVQGQMTGKGWAFIWELDRECDNLDWLVGKKIVVDGKTYIVQGIDKSPVGKPEKGEKYTLLCSSASEDE